MHRIALLILVYMHPSCNAATTIQASSLNCGAPIILNGSTIIQLDVPIEISGPGLCQLIMAGGGFGIGDTVTFVPTAAKTITITSTALINSIGMIEIVDPGIWDLRTFTQPTQRFIFQDIDIILEPGGTILADGVTFELRGASRMITQPVALP